MNFTIKQFCWGLLSFALYTWAFNWMVATMLIVGIGFHEYSHLYAAKKLGLKTKGFYLIPFVGGVALVDGKYKSRRDHAIVAIAGPIGGGALALVVAGLYYFTGVQFFGQAAVWMLVINLLNLFPFSFLDGGQLLSTITYSINRTVGFFALAVSTVIGAIAAYYVSPVIMVIIVFFGSSQVMREYRNWKAYRVGLDYLCDDDYLNPPRKLSLVEGVQVSTCWFILAVVLAFSTVLLYKDSANSLSYLFPSTTQTK